MPIHDEVYTVYMDGRPTQDRGLSRAEADAKAQYWANASNRIRPVISVVRPA